MKIEGNDMLEHDLISIIVPVYNCKNTIEISIGSCFNQTYHNLEIVLIDDGSDDGSGDICDRLAQEDKRVVVIHQSNKGVSSARNNGMDHCTGKYIVFLDADDLLHPCAIERMYQCAIQTGKSLVMCRLTFIHSQEQLRDAVQRVPDMNNYFFTPKKKFHDVIYKDPYEGSSCAKLYSADMLRTVRFQPVSMCEDQIFVLEVLSGMKDDVVLAGNTPMYFYIQRDNSVIHTLSNHHLIDELKSADYIMEIAETNRKDYEKAARCYCVNVAFFTLLNAHDDSDYDIIAKKSSSIIRQNRWKMITSREIPIKTKGACVLSYISMGLLSYLYRPEKR